MFEQVGPVAGSVTADVLQTDHNHTVRAGFQGLPVPGLVEIRQQGIAGGLIGTAGNPVVDLAQGRGQAGRRQMS